jgi:hypothetical protein
MKKLIPFLLSIPVLLCAPRAEAQATTQVVPRQYTLFSGLLTNNQSINTNARTSASGLTRSFRLPTRIRWA